MYIVDTFPTPPEYKCVALSGDCDVSYVGIVAKIYGSVPLFNYRPVSLYYKEGVIDV
jgi:hypothetical protein